MRQRNWLSVSVLVLSGVIASTVIQAHGGTSPDPGDHAMSISATVGQPPLTLHPPEMSMDGRWRLTGFVDSAIVNVLKDDRCSGRRCVIVAPVGEGRTAINMQYEQNGRIMATYRFNVLVEAEVDENLTATADSVESSANPGESTPNEAAVAMVADPAEIDQPVSITDRINRNAIENGAFNNLTTLAEASRPDRTDSASGDDDAAPSLADLNNLVTLLRDQMRHQHLAGALSTVRLIRESYGDQLSPPLLAELKESELRALSDELRRAEGNPTATDAATRLATTLIEQHVAPAISVLSGESETPAVTTAELVHVDTLLASLLSYDESLPEHDLTSERHNLLEWAVSQRPFHDPGLTEQVMADSDLDEPGRQEILADSRLIDEERSARATLAVKLSQSFQSRQQPTEALNVIQRLMQIPLQAAPALITGTDLYAVDALVAQKALIQEAELLAQTHDHTDFPRAYHLLGLASNTNLFARNRDTIKAIDRRANLESYYLNYR